MKVGRRAFIGFVAGAIGGTLLSPLPWKLTDDIAIWTQNWSWRPSPKRGHRAGKPSICNLCGGACSIEVDLIDEKRAIYVRGTSVNPLNKGGLCSLGASAVQFLYAPYRVAQPLKQAKKRGDISGFKPISWKDALSEISKKIRDLKGKDTSGSVACITGQKRSSMFNLWQQFLRACGSKNLFYMPDESDGWALASLSLFGTKVPCAFDLKNVDCVLSFGAEWADGWGGLIPAARMFASFNEEKPGKPLVEVVHISSRYSMSAAKAREWIAVKPGTEAALALGIASVMVQEGKVSYDVKSYRGFEKWNDTGGNSHEGFKEILLKDYNPEKVSRITGVEKGKIVELARLFASSSRAVAIWGNSNGCGPSGFYDNLAFISLNILKGNFSGKGPCYLQVDPPLTPMPDVENDEAEDIPRLDVAAGWDGPLLDSSNAIYPFLDALASGKGYPVEVLFVHEANPVFSLPENHLVKKAIEKAGMVVSLSSFMDETTAMADIVLPAPVMLERWDDICGVPCVPNPVYAISAPVINARFDVKHPGDVLLQLAGHLGGSFKDAMPWKSYEDFIKFRAEGIVKSGKGAISDESTELPLDTVPGKNFKNLKDLINKLSQGYIWYDAPASVDGLIGTKTGKPEFVVSALEESPQKPKKDELYLPCYIEVKPVGNPEEYPLLLSTYSSSYIASGFVPNSYLMMKNVWEFQLKGNTGFVEINPATARKLGFREGDRAVLRTSKGEAKVFVHITRSVPPGVVAVVRGLGHSAYDDYLRAKGVDAASLVEVQVDPVTGVGIEGFVRAKLERA